MQYKMTSDGASVSGLIRISTSKKLLEIKGDYEAVFKVEGTLDKRVNKEIFDRYLVNVGKEIAKNWIKYEATAIKTFEKKIEKEEKALEKLAKKSGQSALMAEAKKREAALKAEAEAQFKSQMDSFVGKAHDGALKAMDQTAKAVLKDKKKLFLKAGKIVVGLVATVAATAVAPPVGAAAIVAAVAGGLGTLATAASDGAKLSKEFIGNLASYQKSLDALDAQISETIKFARACEAKLDSLQIKKALVEQQMERIKKEKPSSALVKDGKLDEVSKQVAALQTAIDKMASFDPKAVEKSLTEVRGTVKNLLSDPVQDNAEKASQLLEHVAKISGMAKSAVEKVTGAIA